MKKIIILVLLLLMLTPMGVASAASNMCTSKSFTIRNWKGEVETPADDEIILLGEETIPPVDGQNAPAPNTPDFTDEVEPGEQSEQGDEEEPEAEPLSTTPPASTEPPTTPSFTDEVDMSEEIETVEPEGEEQVEPEGEEQGELEEPQEMK